MHTRFSLTALFRDRRAAVGVLGALSLTGVLGMGALSVDINQGYHERMRNQRVADMAALAAALAYQTGSDQAVLTPTAQDVVLANGLTGATVAASVAADTPVAGQSAIKVTVRTTVPIALGQALGYTGSYPVQAEAYANLPSAAAPAGPAACMIGLSNTTAISTSGGATINTPGCAVVGVGNIDNQGTGITASQIISGSKDVINNSGTLSANLLTYAVNFTNPSWNTKVPTEDKRKKESKTIIDPLANNAEIAAARTILTNINTNMAKPPALSNPTTTTADDWYFGNTPSANVAGYRVGNSSQYKVPKGTYNIGKLTVDGGIKVTFEDDSVVNIHKGSVQNGGSTLIFGNGTFKINGGFDSGSSGTTFGNGDVHIGSGTVKFAGTSVFGNGNIIINAAVSLGGGTKVQMGAGYHAFGSINVDGGSYLWLGAGDLDVTSGVNVNGGDSTVRMTGAGNIRIGPNGSGNAVVLAGSSNFFMGDGLFSANGHFDTQGGSHVIFGKTLNHYINGNMNIRGGVIFGAGRYTVAGNIENGTGGTVWPFDYKVNGTTVQSYGNTLLEGQSISGYDQAGVNVTFISSGTLNLGGGAKTKLMAATSSTSGGAIADVLFTSLTSTATTWGAGAQNVFVGAVHLPNSVVTMSGGNATLSNGQCFMLIANRITVSGGAQTASACNSIASAVGGGGGTGTGTTTIGLVR